MRTLLWLVTAALCLGGTGCIDVREYQGEWLGRVASEPAVRQGFAEGVRVEPLVLDKVDLEVISATLTTTDGKFKRTPLSRVVKFSNDTLASLTFDGDPLRSYLLFSPLASESGAPPAMMVISLFTDDRVELRILRGNDLFGVFHLTRRDE
jgi:hypothetical protein